MTTVLGLTGTFGSGKSTVAAMMQAHGAFVIDADRIAREAVEPGQPALARIAEEFGTGMLDEHGRLRRRDLARRVFADAEATRRLNAILHPRVRDEARATIDRVPPDRALVVLDVPLLFEAGMDEMCDAVAVVTVGEANRFARLRGRGFAEREIIERLGRQMPQSRKIRRADFVIDNDGALEATERQVLALLDRHGPPSRAPGSGR